jgi:hypothetical protein
VSKRTKRQPSHDDPNRTDCSPSCKACEAEWVAERIQAGELTTRKDRSIQCSVCSRWFTTGGRRGERGASKGLPPLCPAHYHRALRKSPRAKDPTPGQPKRSTKAERLRELVEAANTVVEHVDGGFLLTESRVSRLRVALIAWNVGAR